MAEKYYYNAAGGGATGVDWANAYVAAVTAVGAAAAGDNLWVADDSAEVLAGAMALTSPGTVGNLARIVCARRTGGSVPPVNADLRTTAAISTSGANAITIGGWVFLYGITFSAGSGTSNASLNLGAASGTTGIIAENCTFKLGANNATPKINLGSTTATNLAGAKISWKNCNVVFSNASQSLQPRACWLDWNGGAAAATGTVPNTLIGGTDTGACLMRVRNVDLNGMSTKTLCGTFAGPQIVVFERCKLPASITITAQQTNPGAIIDVIDCDSASGTKRNERYMATGMQLTELTVVRTGTVWVDFPSWDGTNAFSWKIDTTGGTPSVFTPFESMPMAGDWINSTGSPVSQTFEFLTDGVTLTDQHVWVDYEYLGDGSTPLGTVATTYGGYYPSGGSGTNLTTSSVAWNTTGIVSAVKQKITITFTPQQKGLYRAVVRVAKTSTVIYVSPPQTKAQ